VAGSVFVVVRRSDPATVKPTLTIVCLHRRMTSDGYTSIITMQRSLTTDAAKTLIQTFISCRLDYCNSLLYGVSDSLITQEAAVSPERCCTSDYWCQMV